MDCYHPPVVRRSSAVEQLTVNQLVVGSIPTAGATYTVIYQILSLIDRIWLVGRLLFWGPLGANLPEMRTYVERERSNLGTLPCVLLMPFGVKPLGNLAKRPLVETSVEHVKAFAA